MTPALRTALLSARASIEIAHSHAREALRMAGYYGGRTDCLRVAVLMLEGALKNVDEEIAEAAKGRC